MVVKTSKGLAEMHSDGCVVFEDVFTKGAPSIKVDPSTGDVLVWDRIANRYSGVSASIELTADQRAEYLQAAIGASLA